MKRIFAMLALSLSTVALMAVPARPGQWRKVLLKGGGTIRVELRGDENLHFWQAEDGTALTVTLLDADGNEADGTTAGFVDEDGTVSSSTVLTMKKGIWTSYKDLKLVGSLSNAKLDFKPVRRFFLDDVLIQAPTTTAIRSIEVQNQDKATTRVYAIDGRYLGTSLQGLQHGIYIVNGRKVVK